MSLQEYTSTTWFTNPAMDPVPTSISGTGHPQNDAVFPGDRLSTNDSLYGCHVAAPVHPFDKEPMFEKPLTPSDVGKLNRLVVPKQQAEKYFPLGGGDGGAGAGGTLLGFEDEEGKEWRFRYSYWNSSQSYVLTKGWSRYVKEKRLDAGDVVFFERHRADHERMFIGCRRPGSAPAPAGAPLCLNSHAFMPFQYDSIHAPPGLEEQKETGQSSTSSSRQVRLFGVNLDRDSTSQTTSSGSSFLSTNQQHVYHQQSYNCYFNHYINHHNPHHM